MEFVLLRFKETDGVRHFAFDCVAANHSRTEIVVHADVTLARKYDIRIQELPLLCRRLLDALPEGELQASVTLTEDHMIAIHQAAVSAAAKKPPKAPRRTSNTGQAWRNLPV